jgi:Phytanoyl-CoA dioxygenase (PhyH)
MNLAAAEANLAERGWLVLDLPEPAPVFAVRERILSWLREHEPDLRSLEEYHRLELGDDRHFQLLYDLSVYYWEADLGRTIIGANVDLFRALIGADLHIQRYPYVRAVRPGNISDAAPLHRDTYYGASPYEVSVVVPFTGMDSSNALRVISGSHRAGDAEYPCTQTVSQDVAIRSPRHKLGYPYAPRLLSPALMDHAEPVPLKVGQALILMLSLVHGGGIDTGTQTRFSTDIRVVNSWAPVDWSRGVHPDYFVPLCCSAVTATARRYLAANQASGDPAAQAASGERR